MSSKHSTKPRILLPAPGSQADAILLYRHHMHNSWHMVIMPCSMDYTQSKSSNTQPTRSLGAASHLHGRDPVQPDDPWVDAVLGDDKASAQQRCQHGHEAHRIGNRQVAADGPNHPAIASGSVLPSGLRERSQAALTDVMATPLTCIWQRAEHGQIGLHRHCMLRHGKTVAAVLPSMTAWWQLELRHAVSCLHTDGQRCCEIITGAHQRRQPWTADQRAQLAVGLGQPQSGASPEEAH